MFNLPDEYILQGERPCNTFEHFCKLTARKALGMCARIGRLPGDITTERPFLQGHCEACTLQTVSDKLRSTWPYSVLFTESVKWEDCILLHRQAVRACNVRLQCYAQKHCLAMPETLLPIQ